MSEGNTTDQRLYGVPHAEHMEFNAVSVYEQVECDREENDRTPIVIEEWSVTSPRADLPDARTFLEDAVERVEPCVEGYYEAWMDAITPEVEALVDAALDKLAEGVTFCMADVLLATHEVTWDANGEPLFDGEPMYVKRGS